MQGLNRFLDALSNYLAHRKGLLLIVAIVLVLANVVLQFIPGVGWLASSQLLLSLGVIIGLVGVLLAWAL